MYSSPPYDEELIAGQMAAVFINQRPETLIGAEIGSEFSQTQPYHHPHPPFTLAPRSAHALDHHRHMYANNITMHRQTQFAHRSRRGVPETTGLYHHHHHPKRMKLQSGMFNRLPDGIVLRILSFLETPDLLKCAQTCKRFESLCWNTRENWRIIHLRNEGRGDKVLKVIFKRLLGGMGGPMMDPSLPFIERVFCSNGLSDKSLGAISRRCPELTHLQVQSSNEVFDSGVSEVLNKCTNLQHLDLTGCPHVANLFGGHEVLQRRFLLQYLDLTDCVSIDDCSLQNIVRHCPSLVYLYLRRCVQITDAGLKCIASYCASLRELSISDCVKVSDFGLYELAKLGAQLRYLSVAKCNEVSDAGLKMIARRCYKLRYLNTRSCEAVSDDSIICLARCCPRLRAIDIGGCDMSDTGLKVLAESCPNLKKLSLRNCCMVSDNGLNYVAYYCRGLQHLNIQDCQISVEGYRSIKMYCKKCVIEHTNPGFG